MNASPLIGLAKGKRLHLLKVLYEEVLIPPLVYEDVVTRGRGRAGAGAVKNTVAKGWIKVVPVQDPAKIPAEFGGKSEGEVIALALWRNADFVIMDDRKARKHCDRLGLKWVSTGGVIRDAAQQSRSGPPATSFWEPGGVLRPIGARRFCCIPCREPCAPPGHGFAGAQTKRLPLSPLDPCGLCAEGGLPLPGATPYCSQLP